MFNWNKKEKPLPSLYSLGGGVGGFAFGGGRSQVLTDGLLFWYDTTLHSTQQQIFDNATVLESGATIPANQYVYMTWRGVTAEGAQYQLQIDFGMSVNGVSAPYIAINGIGYPTTGSYGSGELPRCYLSDTNDYYAFKLYASSPNNQWGIMATSRNTTGTVGWGAGGSITYIENGLGV